MSDAARPSTPAAANPIAYSHALFAVLEAAEDYRCIEELPPVCGTVMRYAERLGFVTSRPETAVPRTMRKPAREVRAGDVLAVSHPDPEPGLDPSGKRVVRVEIDEADDAVRVYAAEGLACTLRGLDGGVRVYNVDEIPEYLNRMELTAAGLLTLLRWRVEQIPADAPVRPRAVGAGGSALAAAAEPPAAAPGVAAAESHAAEVRPAEADEPYAKLAAAVASLRLIGKQAKTVETIAKGRGELTLANLAAACEWGDDPEGGWNNIRNALNPKLAPHGLRLERFDNRIRVAEVRAKPPKRRVKKQ